MKTTVFVVFDEKDSLADNQKKDDYAKRYCFNTENALKEGDVLVSKAYKANLHIVKVLATTFRYFNKDTGDLSNELTSTKQFEIKNIEVKEREKASDSIICYKVVVQEEF